MGRTRLAQGTLYLHATLTGSPATVRLDSNSVRRVVSHELSKRYLLCISDIYRIAINIFPKKASNISILNKAHH